MGTRVPFLCTFGRLSLDLGHAVLRSVLPAAVLIYIPPVTSGTYMHRSFVCLLESMEFRGFGTLLLLYV